MRLSEVPEQNALQARQQEAGKPTPFPFWKASLLPFMSLKAQSTCYPMQPCKSCEARTGKRNIMYPLADVLFREALFRHLLSECYAKKQISK